MKSKTLITGSQGFIGKILVNEFRNSNKLILVDKKKKFVKTKKFLSYKFVEPQLY